MKYESVWCQCNKCGHRLVVDVEVNKTPAKTECPFNPTCDGCIERQAPYKRMANSVRAI